MSKQDPTEELREQFIRKIQELVDYWSKIPGLAPGDRCDGVAFSILNLLDGGDALPRFTLSAQHYGGEAVIINEDCDMHDEYAEVRRKDHPRIQILKTDTKAEGQS